MEDKKIKICAITTISKTMDWFMCDIMKALSKNGYDVTLICNMEEGFAERQKDYAKCIDLKMSRGVNLKDLLTIPFKLRKIFKENKFDVIYYMSPNASMYAALGGWLARVPTRIYSQCGIRYVSLSGIKRVVFKMVEKLTCLWSTHVKGQSPKNMKFAIDEGLCKKDKISVVGIGGTIGVELDKYRAFDHKEKRDILREKYGISVDAFVYGYVGRINADKGINELITAFKTVSKKSNEIYLVLVGMLDDANPIKQDNLDYAQKSENIILTGNVTSDEVPYYMSMFDVLTHPTYREGFGKVLQEAMGVGLPIITTNVPGPSEVVEDNVSGILCEVKNTNDLIEKMILLYETPSLRESFSKAGLERAEKYFDRPIMIDNILRDMDSVCK